MHRAAILPYAALPAAPQPPLAAPGATRECHDCGLFQTVPALPVHAVAHCLRCRAVLRRARAAPLVRPMAMALSGLALMLVAVMLPFMDLDVYGVGRTTTLLSGPVELDRNGMGELSVVIVAFILVAPTLRLLSVLYVLARLRARRPPRHLARVFRFATWLRPWSMVEVFLLGVFVAYTKLIDLAHVHVGAACYAMAALMLTMATLDAMLDPQAVWEAMPSPPGPSAPVPHEAPGSAAIGCRTCGQVNRGGAFCRRCGSLLERRKPHSESRTWALLIAAACLYVPANILPVLSLTQLGRGQPSTIVGGAIELLDAGMWPLALLVFVASITVPVLKIASLATMLTATHRRSAWRLRERTALYRAIEFIGRWSMIDVFMISILTALVHLGFFAQVYPEPGVLAFCAVVILTMLAAITFDPRLMWDAAQPPPMPGMAGSGRAA